MISADVDGSKGTDFKDFAVLAIGEDLGLSEPFEDPLNVVEAVEGSVELPPVSKHPCDFFFLVISLTSRVDALSRVAWKSSTTEYKR